MVKQILIVGILGAALFGGDTAALAATPFATEVVEYVEGTGVPSDSITLQKFNNPSTALGAPTIDTTGDGFSTGSPFSPVPVVPANCAFRSFELVSIGQGGRLVLKFDHAVMDERKNPCGIDFILFGNSFITSSNGFWMNGDPNALLLTGNVNAERQTVSVSQDGVTWFSFTSGPFADDFAPTLGRVYDTVNPDPALGAGNHWWGHPTTPTKPLPSFLTAASFAGKTVAQVAQMYGDSAGGTGFDISLLGLPWIQYVKIENPTGSGRTPEVDAISDVEPTASPADFDCDGHVTQADLDILRMCRTGPSIGLINTTCQKADFDLDGDVDQDDFGKFQRCYTGPLVAATANCMD